MKIRIKKIFAAAIAFFLVSNISMVNIYADVNPAYGTRTAATLAEASSGDKGSREPESAGNELTDLELTGLSEPAAGRMLETMATVRSAEGVSWEVPVVWVNDRGESITRASDGDKYFPNIIFYIPSGYRVRTAADGSLSIRLPRFLEEMYGRKNLVCIMDPATGISYLSFATAVIDQGISVAAGSNTTGAVSDDTKISDKNSDNIRAKDSVIDPKDGNIRPK